MENFAFRRHSFSYGQFLDSLETESLLGVASSASGDLLQMDGLYSKTRGASFSNCSGLKLKDHTLECAVLPSDTLLSLALKYNVQVAEIKRVNNIFTDGEVFALKKIRIPVRPASLLTDLLPGDPPQLRVEEWNEETEESPNKSLFSVSASSEQLTTEGGSEADSEESASLRMFNNQYNKQKRKVKKIFKEVDKDMDLIKSKQANLEDGINISELVGQSSTSTVHASQVSKFNSSVFKSACVCAFMVVASFIVMGGLVMVISIKHSETEEDW